MTNQLQAVAVDAKARKTALAFFADIALPNPRKK